MSECGKSQRCDGSETIRSATTTGGPLRRWLVQQGKHDRRGRRAYSTVRHERNGVGADAEVGRAKGRSVVRQRRKADVVLQRIRRNVQRDGERNQTYDPAGSKATVPHLDPPGVVNVLIQLILRQCVAVAERERRENRLVGLGGNVLLRISPNRTGSREHTSTRAPS